MSICVMAASRTKCTLLDVPHDVFELIARMTSIRDTWILANTCRELRDMRPAMMCACVAHASMDSAWRMLRCVDYRPIVSTDARNIVAHLVQRCEPLLSRKVWRYMHTDVQVILLTHVNVFAAHYILKDILQSDATTYNMLDYIETDAASPPPSVHNTSAWRAIEERAYERFLAARVRLARAYLERIRDQLFVREMHAYLCLYAMPCVYAVWADTMLARYGVHLGHLPSDGIRLTQYMNVSTKYDERRQYGRKWVTAWQCYLLSDLRSGMRDVHYRTCVLPRTCTSSSSKTTIALEATAKLLGLGVESLVGGIPYRLVDSARRPLDFLRAIERHASADEIIAACVACELHVPGIPARTESQTDDDYLRAIYDSGSSFTRTFVEEYAVHKYIYPLIEAIIRITPSRYCLTHIAEQYSRLDLISLLEKLLHTRTLESHVFMLHVFAECSPYRKLSLPAELYYNIIRYQTARKSSDARQMRGVSQALYAERPHYDSSAPTTSTTDDPISVDRQNTDTVCEYTSSARDRILFATTQPMTLTGILDLETLSPSTGWYVCYLVWSSSQSAQALLDIPPHSAHAETLRILYEQIRSFATNIHADQAAVQFADWSSEHRRNITSFVLWEAFQRTYDVWQRKHQVNCYYQQNTMPICAVLDDDATLRMYHPRMAAQLQYARYGKATSGDGVAAADTGHMIPYTPVNRLTCVASELLCFPDMLALVLRQRDAIYTNKYVRNYYGDIFANYYSSVPNGTFEHVNIVPPMYAVQHAWLRAKNPREFISMIRTLVDMLCRAPIPEDLFCDNDTDYRSADAVYRRISPHAPHVREFLLTLMRVQKLKQHTGDNATATATATASTPMTTTTAAEIHRLMSCPAVGYFFSSYVLRWGVCDESIILVNDFAAAFAPFPRRHARQCIGYANEMLARLVFQFYSCRKDMARDIQTQLASLSSNTEYPHQADHNAAADT